MNKKHLPGEVFSYNKQCQIEYGKDSIRYMNETDWSTREISPDRYNKDYCDNVNQTRHWKRVGCTAGKVNICFLFI